MGEKALFSGAVPGGVTERLLRGCLEVEVLRIYGDATEEPLTNELKRLVALLERCYPEPETALD